MEIQTICDVMHEEHKYLDYNSKIKVIITLSNNERIFVDYSALDVISEEKVLQVRYCGEYRTIYFDDIKDFEYQVEKTYEYYL